MVLRGSESGRALMQWVNEHYPEQSVILMSGFDADESGAADEEANYPLQLTKPFLLRDLARGLQQALR